MVALERTRFYPRQMVGPDELTQDQRWIRDKMRRHNRLLHGWGVVCGCDVRQAYDRDGAAVPWTVVVQPGDVLGPFGDEIVVDVDTTFDVRLDTAADVVCAEPPDPWCSDVRVSRRPRITLYLAIRYDEHPTRPVRTAGACGCHSDHTCEYSRIRESFTLAILDELPASYRAMVGADTTTLAGLNGALRCAREWEGAVRRCPPCPTDPWVILADVVADTEGVLTIDPIRHRRYVASFAEFWFSCASPKHDEPTRLQWTAAQKIALNRLLAPSVMTRLQEFHDGAVDEVPNVEANALLGVNERSPVGRFVRTSTVADIAARTRDEFVNSATAEKVSAKRAGEVWDAARAVVTTLRDG